MAFFDDNGDWEVSGSSEIVTGYGERKGNELVALGNAAQLLRYNGPPWLVSRTSLLEFSSGPGPTSVMDS